MLLSDIKISDFIVSLELYLLDLIINSEPLLTFLIKKRDNAQREFHNFDCNGTYPKDQVTDDETSKYLSSVCNGFGNKYILLQKKDIDDDQSQETSSKVDPYVNLVLKYLLHGDHVYGENREDYLDGNEDAYLLCVGLEIDVMHKP